VMLMMRSCSKQDLKPSANVSKSIGKNTTRNKAFNEISQILTRELAGWTSFYKHKIDPKIKYHQDPHQ